MKRSKLESINKSTFLEDIYGYNFVMFFYSHESACDNYSNVYAVNTMTNSNEYVCYSTCAENNNIEIKNFLIEKIIKKTKLLFNNFYFEIKQLKNGIKINNKVFKLKTYKINSYALLNGTNIKDSDFIELELKIRDFLKKLK